MTPMPAAIFSWPVRVYYEDTDVSGVVYHASYVRFLERARTEWLRARGGRQQALIEREAIAFTVASLQIDFVRPARLDDDLLVSVEVEELRLASLRIRQAVTREGQVLARAQVRVGCVDVATFRPRPLPPDLHASMKPPSEGIAT